jgi:hypothetical protein
VEHVVFFPASDGSPAFRRVASLDEAVRLVEHLRNVEGVNEVSCHALTEVPLAFRAYYRVEVPTGDLVAGLPLQAVHPVDALSELAAVPDGPVEVAEMPEVAEPVGAVNGRSADGAASLGFFA